MYQIGSTLLDPAIMGEVVEDSSHARAVREAQTGVEGDTEVRIDLNASRRLRLSGRAPLLAIVPDGFAVHESRTANAYAVLAAMRGYKDAQALLYNGFSMGMWLVSRVGHRVGSSTQVAAGGSTYTVARWLDWRLELVRMKGPAMETAVPIPGG